MSATPWFKFFPGDYLADTKRLTQAQHGAYMLILLDYYANGEAPPDDDNVLRRISLSDSRSDWLAIRPAIAKYFAVRDGKWINERCEIEILARKKDHTNKSENGKKGNEIRWGRSPSDEFSDNSSDSPSDPVANRKQHRMPDTSIALGAPLIELPAAARPIQSQKLAPPPSGLPAAPRLGATNGARRTRKAAEPAKSSLAWESYSGAYRSRYGTDPVRNSKSNALLCHLVDRLGVEEAPPVAAFYVRHNAEWYVKNGHALDYLIRDAEKLRTEWATGNGVTSSQARQIDRTQGQANVWGKLIAEAQAEERQNGEK